jgi:RNA polymerase sigma factor (sigma-70 family)
MLDDGALLRRYAEDGSQAAYAELVQRHIRLVYHAALRRVGRNAHTADDVTQRVFTDLARKAGSLAGRPNLAGWLYTSTRFAAAEAVRSERRRRTHEQEAHAMRELDSPSPGDSERLEPFLDQVMDFLPAADRDAVVLHFLEGCTFPEVGAVLGLSPDAVRMRVNRALERLRAGLAERGVDSSAEALTTALSGLGALSVPTGLTQAVTQHALGGARAASPFRRLLRAVRASPATPWAGTALLLGIAGLSVAGYRSAHPIPGPSAAGGSAAAQIPDADGVAPDRTAAEVETEPEPAAAAGQEAPEPRPALAPLAFAALSEPEKHILRALVGQDGHGVMPGFRVVLHVGDQAPNAADFEVGRDDLLARGWIATGPFERRVFLTPAGRAYCAAHAAELAACPPFYPRAAPKP